MGKSLSSVQARDRVVYEESAYKIERLRRIETRAEPGSEIVAIAYRRNFNIKYQHILWRNIYLRVEAEEALILRHMNQTRPDLC